MLGCDLQRLDETNRASTPLETSLFPELRVQAMEEKRLRRLADLQAFDLGMARREEISTTEKGAQGHAQSAEDLEAGRRANQPGTIEHKVAQKNKQKALEWKNAWVSMEPDEEADKLEEINGGQSHRQALTDRLRTPESQFTGLAASGGFVGRGGSARGAGRGGGVMGSRGRGRGLSNTIATRGQANARPVAAPLPRQGARAHIGGRSQHSRHMSTTSRGAKAQPSLAHKSAPNPVAKGHFTGASTSAARAASMVTSTQSSAETEPITMSRTASIQRNMASEPMGPVQSSPANKGRLGLGPYKQQPGQAAPPRPVRHPTSNYEHGLVSPADFMTVSSQVLGHPKRDSQTISSVSSSSANEKESLAYFKRMTIGAPRPLPMIAGSPSDRSAISSQPSGPSISVAPLDPAIAQRPSQSSSVHDMESNRGVPYPTVTESNASVRATTPDRLFPPTRPTVRLPRTSESTMWLSVDMLGLAQPHEPRPPSALSAQASSLDDLRGLDFATAVKAESERASSIEVESSHSWRSSVADAGSSIVLRRGLSSERASEFSLLIDEAEVVVDAPPSSTYWQDLLPTLIEMPIHTEAHHSSVEAQVQDMKEDIKSEPNAIDAFLGSDENKDRAERTRDFKEEKDESEKTIQGQNQNKEKIENFKEGEMSELSEAVAVLHFQHATIQPIDLPEPNTQLTAHKPSAPADSTFRAAGEPARRPELTSSSSSYGRMFGPARVYDGPSPFQSRIESPKTKRGRNTVPEPILTEPRPERDAITPFVSLSGSVHVLSNIENLFIRHTSSIPNWAKHFSIGGTAETDPSDLVGDSKNVRAAANIPGSSDGSLASSRFAPTAVALVAQQTVHASSSTSAPANLGASSSGVINSRATVQTIPVVAPPASISVSRQSAATTTNTTLSPALYPPNPLFEGDILTPVPPRTISFNASGLGGGLFGSRYATNTPPTRPNASSASNHSRTSTSSSVASASLQPQASLSPILPNRQLSQGGLAGSLSESKHADTSLAGPRPANRHLQKLRQDLEKENHRRIEERKKQDDRAEEAKQRYRY
ncbi:MAG: hypothetical protein M1827_002860 [Pycnora praestabilis]|nr:MAG: hypothetical protein M1827_002860 [Pycnora praestabilis]